MNAGRLFNKDRTERTVNPLPPWVSLLSGIGLCYLVIPIVFMGARVPWATLGTHLQSEAARSALQLSLGTATVALVVDLLLGIPLAAYLASSRPGVKLARILVTLPLSLPPVVAGIALLSAFGRRSIIGSALDQMGVQLAFSTTAVVLAQVFVSLPFLVVTLEAALRTRPKGLEETALGLGATPTIAFLQITIPQVATGLVRGSALALARCLGEFGATLTFAGSLQGVTRTMPLQIYLAREEDQATALSLGMVLIILAIVLLAITEWTSRLSPQPALGSDEHDGLVEPEGPTPLRTPRLEPRSCATIQLCGRIEQRHWDVDLTLPPGSITAVMGHNGAGKSTLGQVIAGTLRVDSGEVRIDGRIVDGPGTFVGGRNRYVAVVNQSPQLFSHMTVLDNVAKPLRWRGVSKEDALQRARQKLAEVGCQHLEHRKATDLSGGQAARVALARALVFEPRVLILDEPTAALDIAAKAQIQQLIASHLCEHPITTLLITHDIVEAIQLGDRLVVLQDGAVAEVGEPVAVIRQPSSPAGAKLAGLNVLGGVVVETREALGRLCVEGTIELAGLLPSSSPVPLEVDDHAAALFSPETVSLFAQPVQGSPRTSIPGVIQHFLNNDGLVTVTVRIAPRVTITARITTEAWSQLKLEIGQGVWMVVKATQTRIVPIPG